MVVSYPSRFEFLGTYTLKVKLLKKNSIYITEAKNVLLKIASIID